MDRSRIGASVVTMTTLRCALRASILKSVKNAFFLLLLGVVGCAPAYSGPESDPVFQDVRQEKDSGRPATPPADAGAPDTAPVDASTYCASDEVLDLTRDPGTQGFATKKGGNANLSVTGGELKAAVIARYDQQPFAYLSHGVPSLPKRLRMKGTFVVDMATDTMLDVLTIVLVGDNGAEADFVVSFYGTNQGAPPRLSHYSVELRNGQVVQGTERTGDLASTDTGRSIDVEYDVDVVGGRVHATVGGVASDFQFPAPSFTPKSVDLRAGIAYSAVAPEVGNNRQGSLRFQKLSYAVCP